MPNKDLSHSLYNEGVFSDDSNDDCQKSAPLDWVTRLKIATGAAQGIEPYSVRHVDGKQRLLSFGFGFLLCMNC